MAIETIPGAIGRARGGPAAPAPTPAPLRIPRWWRDASAAALWVLLLGVVALWVAGGGVQQLGDLAGALTSPRERPTAVVTMSPAEWRWAIGAALLVLGLSCIPYGVAWLRQDGAQQFTGFLLSADDGHTYLAKMAQGARGDDPFGYRAEAVTLMRLAEALGK